MPDGKTFDQHLHRRNQAEIVQHAGSQGHGQIMNRLHLLGDGLFQPRDTQAGLSLVFRVLQHLDIHHDRSQGLTGLVVEFAGDPFSLVFLPGHDPLQEIPLKLLLFQSGLISAGQRTHHSVEALHELAQLVLTFRMGQNHGIIPAPHRPGRFEQSGHRSGDDPGKPQGEQHPEDRDQQSGPGKIPGDRPDLAAQAVALHPDHHRAVITVADPDLRLPDGSLVGAEQFRLGGLPRQEGFSCQQIRGKAAFKGVGHHLAFGVTHKDIAQVRAVLHRVAEHPGQAVDIVDQQIVVGLIGKFRGHEAALIPEKVFDFLAERRLHPVNSARPEENDQGQGQPHNLQLQRHTKQEGSALAHGLPKKFLPRGLGPRIIVHTAPAPAPQSAPPRARPGPFRRPPHCAGQGAAP